MAVPYPRTFLARISSPFTRATFTPQSRTSYQFSTPRSNFFLPVFSAHLRADLIFSERSGSRAAPIATAQVGQ